MIIFKEDLIINPKIFSHGGFMCDVDFRVPQVGSGDTKEEAMLSFFNLVSSNTNHPIYTNAFNS